TTAGLSADQSRAVEPEQAPAPPIDSEGKSSNIEQVGSTEPWNIPEVELLDPPGEESSLAAYDGPLKSPLRSPLKRTADVELAAAAPPPVAPAATAGDPFSVRASAASMTGIPDLTARPPSAVANPAGRKNSA